MKRVVFFSVMVFLALLLALSSASAGPWPEWKLFYHAIPMGDNFWARAINNNGQVAGRTPGGHAAVWYKCRLNLLNINADWSEAFGINDRGTVLVAWTKGRKYGRSLIDRNGKIENIPIGSKLLNNARQVAGDGFLWQNGKLILISNPSQGICTVTGLNNKGEITGFLWGMGDGEHPFRWTKGKLSYLELPDSITEGRPEDINDRGLIVGHIVTGQWGEGSPVVWTPNGQMIQLSNMHGGVVDINDRGDILGWVDLPGQSPQTVIWKKDGSTALLDQHVRQPLHLFSPIGINDAGQIICSGGQNDKYSYYFLQPCWKR